MLNFGFSLKNIKFQEGVIVMKRDFLIVLMFGLIGVTLAESTINVYQADGITPYYNNTLMEGSQLTLLITTDCNDYWSGGVFIANDNRLLGELNGIDTDPNTRDWDGSHYDNAGYYANITSWKDSNIWGYDLYGSDVNSVPGDWFIINYEAIGAGDPNVWFLDYNNSWKIPTSVVSFNQIKSLDYNTDDIVNLYDFAIISQYWLANNCEDPNWCEGADIDENGIVDSNDIILFGEFWMWEPDRIIQTESNNTSYDNNALDDVDDVNDLEVLLTLTSLNTTTTTTENKTTEIANEVSVTSISSVSTTSLSLQESESLTGEQIIKKLEQIWEQDSVRAKIPEEQWEAFINELKGEK